MRPLMAWLVGLALIAGPALAQCFPPTVSSGAGTSSATTTVTTASAPLQGFVCPVESSTVNPCPVQVGTNLTGEPVILVLGTEEHYALSNIPAFVDRENSPLNYASIFSPGNPLTSWRPNGVVTRNGNPYSPYYQLDSSVRVAGLVERYGTLTGEMAQLSAENRDTLNLVAARYRDLTLQQATLLGYCPVSACLDGYGQVYVNNTLIDNQFYALQPEAFTFDQRGNVASFHYILLADQPFAAFGQRMQPSPLVQGAQQLGVWAYQSNPSGMFALANPRQNCATTSVAGMEERRTMWAPTCMSRE